MHHLSKILVFTFKQGSAGKLALSGDKEKASPVFSKDASIEIMTLSFFSKNELLIS